MKRTINQIKIRVCDRYPVKTQEFINVDFEDDLFVGLKGSIVKREVKNNQDGTIDLVLWFKANEFEIKR